MTLRLGAVRDLRAECTEQEPPRERADERGWSVDLHKALVHHLGEALLSDHQPVQVDRVSPDEQVLLEPRVIGGWSNARRVPREC